MIATLIELRYQNKITPDEFAQLMVNKFKLDKNYYVEFETYVKEKFPLFGDINHESEFHIELGTIRTIGRYYLNKN